MAIAAVAITWTLFERGSQTERQPSAPQTEQLRRNALPVAVTSTRSEVGERPAAAPTGRVNSSRVAAITAELTEVDRWFDTLAPNQSWLAGSDERLRTTANRGEKLGVLVDRAECRAGACRVEITHLQEPPREPEVVRLGQRGRLFRFEEGGKWKSVAFFPAGGAEAPIPTTSTRSRK